MILFVLVFVLNFVFTWIILLLSFVLALVLTSLVKKRLNLLLFRICIIYQFETVRSKKGCMHWDLSALEEAWFFYFAVRLHHSVSSFGVHYQSTSTNNFRQNNISVNLSLLYYSFYAFETCLYLYLLNRL